MGDQNPLKQELIPMYRVSKQELCGLVDLDKIRSKESDRVVESLGGLKGLLDHLKTGESSGISGDKADRKSRKHVFGKNKPHKRKQVGFFAFVWECFEDTTLQILIAGALVSLIFGTLENPAEGWMEGVAILAAVLLVVFVTAINNYAKEIQFRKLSEEAADSLVTVVRDSKELQKSIFKLLVGDVVKVGAGNIMSVDAIVLRSVGLLLDESSMTGEPDYIKKGRGERESPFLISGTQVVEGTGVMLVIAVGDDTFQGKNALLLLEEDEEETPLQQKLNRISQNVSMLGFSAALLTFAVLVAYIVADSLHEKQWGNDSWQRLISGFIVAVTIIVVAVPEGLPLAVTLSLAYSVNKMKKMNNLVRHLNASETMGQATAICSDKTGTLTQNVMKVVSLYAQDTKYTELTQESLSEDTLRLLVEAACFNSEASISYNSDGEKTFTGSRTEIALLDLVASFGYDYTAIRDPQQIAAQVPFSSKLKRMITVISVNGALHAHVKGASEIVLGMCTSYINSSGAQEELTEDKQREITSNVIDQYAAGAQRTLTLAYKRLEPDFPHTQEGAVNQEELEKDLVLLAIVGIEDPIRKEVPSAIQTCQRAGITVRMVTGDNKQTATAIALKCNILQSSHEPDAVLEGAEFRKRVKGLITLNEATGEPLAEGQKTEGLKITEKVGDMAEFSNIVKNLKVLARSSPTDKYILVTGLKALGEVVAVTGDGSNDAPALKKANVGFAMHIAGTQLAQEACDIILLDDNFASIVVAVLWGRNIYDCISKFIQFQLTVNVVALVLSFVGACVLERSPLTAVQMLWVNLIMDTFAALALATEPPSAELLERLPVKPNDSLITADMMKNIIGESIYQVVWLFVILFLGPELFQVPPAWDVSGNTAHFTLFFNCFVFLQVFNEINCRKLKSSELNVFKGFFNNWLFLMILVLTVVVQVALVQFGGEPLNVVPLSAQQHLWCVLIGMGGLPFGVLVRLMPSRPFKCCRVGEKPLPSVEADRRSLASIMRRRTTNSFKTSARAIMSTHTLRRNIKQ